MFPGDLLLKNFGVTRTAASSSTTTTSCASSPTATSARSRAARRDDELAAEPWFYVGENDVFPEEFIRFLGLRGRLRGLLPGRPRASS